MITVTAFGYDWMVENTDDVEAVIETNWSNFQEMYAYKFQDTDRANDYLLDNCEDEMQETAQEVLYLATKDG